MNGGEPTAGSDELVEELENEPVLEAHELQKENL
jgi:hypothetical protein